MSQYIFNMIDLGKVVNDKVILKGIYLSFLPGAKIGVLGNNGAGKSTLLRIMAGVDSNFTGEAFPQKGIKIGYLPQEPQLDPDKTVLESIEDAVSENKALLKRYEALSLQMCEPLSDDEMQKVIDESSNVQEEIEAKNLWELDRTIEMAMDSLDCPPKDSLIKNLSGGEKRRVALCRLVLSQPDMLLLDEPTNHLDAESVEWLEHFLHDFKGTVVAVTHDRYFLDNVAGWILELDRGSGIPWQGNYSSWLEQKSARLAVEEKQESARQRSLKRELEWVRMSAKARHAKSKARLQAYYEMAAEQPKDRADALREIVFPKGPRLGENVVIAENISKSFGDRTLFKELSFRIPPNAMVGIIGPNGAGKSTLFKMIVGLEKPDAGTLTLGETVKIAHVDQNRETLNGDKTIFDEIAHGADYVEAGGRQIPSRAYISSFGFRGPDQQKLVKFLSGGERNRLNLCKLVMSGGNVLMLDEPTNDLDVDTLRALEEGLSDFEGCTLIISHDRWFLDRIATHMLAFEDDGAVVWFAGNYQDYMADKKRRLGDNASSGKGRRYRKIQI